MVFALWFASGAVLLFKSFPSLSRSDQIKLEAPIDLASVRITPAQALGAGGSGADGLRLVQRGIAPAYIVVKAGVTTVVDARSGARIEPLDAGSAGQIGRQRLGGATTASPVAFDYDQWVVHNRFDPYRPFFRLDLADGAGTQYYLSARTGELVQRTTFADRGWNWIGAVLHWAYFTPLRSNFSVWDQSIWWLSLVAMFVAIAGTVLGVIRTMAAQRQRKPAFTFYRLKWMRWHHLIGLFASLFVLTWILSGWLSMDHGRLFSRGQTAPTEAAGYATVPLASAVATIAPSALGGLGDVREVDFNAVSGGALLTAWGADGQPRQFDAKGTRLAGTDVIRMISRGIAGGWPGEAVPAPASVAPTDLYALAEGWPASALRFVDPTHGRPDIVVDGATGQILTVLNGSRKSYAWIYYALHTFNFPGLTEHQVLRQAIALVPLLLGFVFSITGVVLGYQRLRKSF